jgi:beta-N-acetylhexosaminidase
MAVVLVLVRLALAAAVLPLALDWRSPLLSSVRPWALAALVGLLIGIITVEIVLWARARRRPQLVRILSGGTLIIAALDLVCLSTLEARFQWTRRQVLNADPDRLHRLGRHFIVGYNHVDDVEALVRRKAIAGVFVAARNVQGKTAGEIKQSITTLQAIRREQGLAPLWIATDQEGGSVSRLSPPLPRRPAIPEIVARHHNMADRRKAVAQFALMQGQELSGIGVNLNFAPVVDLNHRIVNPGDRFTRIHARAISDDATVVLDVAAHYCSALQQSGVRCTLKHFPGLGRVFADTHLESADLDVPTSELANTDWIPFRALMRHANAFTMLGHARLTAIDRARPVSFSQPVVAMLRSDWRYDGVLITDDFTMGAVYGSPEGIAGASVAALNAGVDLILVSYDADQYFTAMHALLEADRAGRLHRDALVRSAQRLNAAVGH